MKKFYKFRPVLFFIICTILFYGCSEQSYYDEDCINYNYSDCNTKEPEHVDFHVKLTINTENPAVPIVIYEGEAETGKEIIYDTVNISKKTYKLSPDKYYSVRARYIKNDKIIYAFDGDRISKKANRVCDSICWEVDEGYVNVELK